MVKLHILQLSALLLLLLQTKFSFGFLPVKRQDAGKEPLVVNISLENVTEKNDKLLLAFFPKALYNLEENDEKNVSFIYSLKSSKPLEVLLSIKHEVIARITSDLNFTLLPTEDWLILSENGTLNYTFNDETAKNKYFNYITVKGLFLGRTRIQLAILADGSVVKKLDYKVSVIRKERLLDQIFIAIIVVFVIIGNLVMGTKLKLSIVKEVLKKPIAPLIGFFCQYTIMPAVAFGVGYLLKLDASVALGYFGMGCAPGGGASNFYCLLLGGDISLSITMTLISTIASLGMVPLWMFTLGQYIFDAQDVEVKIPFENILTSLASIVFPIGIGYLIKLKLPKLRKFIKKLIKPIVVVFIIFVFTAGVYSNLYIFKLFSPLMILAGCLLPYAGFILGGATAFAFRQPWFRVKTIGIETGIQNPGVPIFILKYSLPQPDADLAVVGPVAAITFTPFPLWIWIIIHTIRKKMRQRGEVTHEYEAGTELNRETMQQDTIRPESDGENSINAEVAKL